MKNRINQVNGFTLIELLVVISIIALLLAILMPSLNRAREQAKKAVCSSNTHQIALAANVYISEYDGRFNRAVNHGLWNNRMLQGLPPEIIAGKGSSGNPLYLADRPTDDAVNPLAQSSGRNGGQTGAGGRTGGGHLVEYSLGDRMAYWGIAYKKYTDGKQVFHCPSHKRVDDWPEDDWGEEYQEYFYYSSYGINGYVAGKFYDYKDGERLSNIRRPSSVVFLQDHIEQRQDSVDEDMFCIGPGKSINLPQWRSREESNDAWGHVDTVYEGGTWKNHDTVGECFRHNNNSVTVYLDAHVETIQRTTGEDVSRSWYNWKM